MKKTLAIFCVLAVALTACQKGNHFCVEGNIANAEGKTLFVEHTALLKTEIIDSCQLKANGHFRFQEPSPEYPDFYRLRIGKQYVVLAVDSTETITISTSPDSLNSTENISGSEQSVQIAQLRHAVGKVSSDSLKTMSRNVIVANPRSSAAYYALFLRQDGRLIWNIMNPQERRWYQAVATSYQAWMPEYERTKALYAQVSEVIALERKGREAQKMREFIDAAENTFLDITLFDEKDHSQTLSDLRGHVIVLDFSMTQMERAQGYVFALRDLYNKYHQRGMEIYSVSVDQNKLAWQDAVRELPWVTVIADNGVNDEALRTYNVQQIPTLFLIDKSGTVQGRFADFESLDAAIQKYL